MTDRTLRVLVTGSRTWPDEHLVRRELARVWTDHGGPVVVVHGACAAGADHHAAQWVADMNAAGYDAVSAEPHPANWDAHGRAAGPIRNRLMVEAGADRCLAFIHCGSRGASNCAQLAETAGISTRRWTA